MSIDEEECGSVENILPELNHLRIPLSSVNLDPDNTRQHDARNLATIEYMLQTHGQYSPIVVQKQGMIVRIGNGRVEVARRMGWQEIAAIVVDKEDADALAMAVGDNRSSELGVWDYENLSSALQELISVFGEGEDLSGMGWEEYEIGSLLQGEWNPPSNVEDMFDPDNPVEEEEEDDEVTVDTINHATCPKCGACFVLDRS